MYTVRRCYVNGDINTPIAFVGVRAATAERTCMHVSQLAQEIQSAA